MRASDLIFLAGVPELNDDRYNAELAHLTPDGKPSEVLKLELVKLLFTEEHTASALNELAANHLLRPSDQIVIPRKV